MRAWRAVSKARTPFEKQNMQSVKTYEWAADEVVKVTRKHLELKANARRLRQMQAKREKDAKRKARMAETVPGA